MVFKRFDLRTGDGCPFDLIEGFFHEESERKLRGDAYTLQLKPPAARGNQGIRQQPAAAWRELGNVDAAIQITTIADVKYLQ
jgi:hypothetical protein